MMILSLVRNYIPSYQWVVDEGWNIADCVSRSYDLEAMEVGTVAAGRIGLAVLKRLKPFDVKLHYTDRHRLPESREGAGPDVPPERRVDGARLRRGHDQRPLHPETEHLFNDELIGKMKRGAYLVNTARGKICDRDAIVRALGERPACRICRRRLVPAAGAEGSPVADDAPSRHDAPYLGHILSAQARYAAGTREILECWFERRPIREEYLIVDGGKLAGAGAHSYSAGNATRGSEEAAKFKN